MLTHGILPKLGIKLIAFHTYRRHWQPRHQRLWTEQDRRVRVGGISGVGWSGWGGIFVAASCLFFWLVGMNGWAAQLLFVFIYRCLKDAFAGSRKLCIMFRCCCCCWRGVKKRQIYLSIQTDRTLTGWQPRTAPAESGIGGSGPNWVAELSCSFDDAAWCIFESLFKHR